MELREFAETILYGNNLTQDKLLHPEYLTDLNPGLEILSPHFPNRPKGLEFNVHTDKKKIEFPNQNDLENEKQRGFVLHFFANHELLAMELMALAILKFPQAPKSFRMGIAKTILEEQRHMQMYMERMKDFQIEFGEIPVNDFFWKCLSNMNSPMDYVTKLSMTFEQANLDYSYFYMNLMAKIGDNKTAEILKTVFEEEIGHVKHGVIWFDKLRDQSLSQWECYTNQLKLPLSPARAKGIQFNKAARINAGLSLSFIDELSVFSSSKGRPPEIYYFNPACELEVLRAKPGFTSSKAFQHLQQDCSSLCLFLSSQEDIVLVPKKPSLEFLQNLKQCGFDLPQWYEYKDKLKLNITDFQQNLFGSLKPWGWSPECSEFLKVFSPKLSPKNKFYDHQKFFSKIFSSQLSHEINNEFKHISHILPENNTLPIVCLNLNAALDTINNFFNVSSVVVLKAPYSAAGQNMRRVESKILSKNEINWINNVLSKQQSIIIEPWFHREADFSCQLKIENNKIIYIGQTRCLNDHRGQYIGTFLGKKIEDLNPDLIEFIYKNHGNDCGNFFDLFKKISLSIGEKLMNSNFEGPFGIDVFIYRDNTSPLGFRIKFISEINPRYTMGRIALEISKRIQPGTMSLWLHLRIQDIEKKFKSKINFMHKVTKEYPIQITNSFKPQIKSGILFTNDLLLAEKTATILIVGKENINSFQNLYYDNTITELS